MNLNFSIYKYYGLSQLLKIARLMAFLTGLLLLLMVIISGLSFAKTIDVNVYRDSGWGLELIEGRGSVGRGIVKAEVELWKEHDKLEKITSKMTDRFGAVIFELPEDELLGKYYVRVLTPKLEGIAGIQTWSHASVENRSSVNFSRYCQLENPLVMGDKPFASAGDEGSEYCLGRLTENRVSDKPSEWASYSMVEIKQGNFDKLTLSFAFDAWVSKAIAPNSYSQGEQPYHLSVTEQARNNTYNDEVGVFGLGETYGGYDPKTQLEFSGEYWENGYEDNDGVYVKSTHETEYVPLQKATLSVGETYDFRVYTSSNSETESSQFAYLNAWIDWTTDGVKGYFREPIIQNAQDRLMTAIEQSSMPEELRYLGNGRIITFSYTVPNADISGAMETYARFRFSSIKDLGPIGQGLSMPGVDQLVNGEIEDYLLFIRSAPQIELTGNCIDCEDSFLVLWYKSLNASNEFPSKSEAEAHYTISPYSGKTLVNSSPLLISDVNKPISLDLYLKKESGEHRILAEFTGITCQVNSKEISVDIDLENALLTIPPTAYSSGQKIACAVEYRTDIKNDLDRDKTTLFILKDSETVKETSLISDGLDSLIIRATIFGVGEYQDQPLTGLADRLALSLVNEDEYRYSRPKYLKVQSAKEIAPGVYDFEVRSPDRIVASETVELLLFHSLDEGGIVFADSEVTINHQLPEDEYNTLEINVLNLWKEGIGSLPYKELEGMAIELWQDTLGELTLIESKKIGQSANVSFFVPKTSLGDYLVRAIPEIPKDSLRIIQLRGIETQATNPQSIEFRNSCLSADGRVEELVIPNKTMTTCYGPGMIESLKPADSDVSRWSIYTKLKIRDNPGNIKLDLFVNNNGSSIGEVKGAFHYQSFSLSEGPLEYKESGESDSEYRENFGAGSSSSFLSLGKAYTFRIPVKFLGNVNSEKGYMSIWLNRAGAGPAELIYKNLTETAGYITFDYTVPQEILPGESQDFNFIRRYSHAKDLELDDRNLYNADGSVNIIDGRISRDSFRIMTGGIITIKPSLEGRAEYFEFNYNFKNILEDELNLPSLLGKYKDDIWTMPDTEWGYVPRVMVRAYGQPVVISQRLDTDNYNLKFIRCEAANNGDVAVEIEGSSVTIPGTFIHDNTDIVCYFDNIIKKLDLFDPVKSFMQVIDNDGDIQSGDTVLNAQLSESVRIKVTLFDGFNPDQRLVGYKGLSLGSKYNDPLNGNISGPVEGENGEYYFTIQATDKIGEDTLIFYNGDVSSRQSVTIHYTDGLEASSLLNVTVYKDSLGEGLGNYRETDGIASAIVELWKVETTRNIKLAEKATDGSGKAGFELPAGALDAQYYVRLQPIENNVGGTRWFSGQTWAGSGVGASSNAVITHMCQNHAGETTSVVSGDTQCYAAHHQDHPSSTDPKEWAIYSLVETKGSTEDINLAFAVSSRGNFGSGNFADGIFHFNPAPEKETQSLRLGKLVDSQESPKKYVLGSQQWDTQYDGVQIRFVEDTQYFEDLDRVMIVPEKEYEFRVFVSGETADKAYLNAWVTNETGTPISLVKDLQYSGQQNSDFSRYTADGKGRYITFKASIPALVASAPIFARFRFSSVKDLPFSHDTEVQTTKFIPDGEVEDYKLNVGANSSIAAYIKTIRHSASIEGTAEKLTLGVGKSGSPDYKWVNSDILLSNGFHQEIINLGNQVPYGEDLRIIFGFLHAPGFGLASNIQCFSGAGELELALTLDAQKNTIATIPWSQDLVMASIQCNASYVEDTAGIDLDASSIYIIDNEEELREIDLVVGGENNRVLVEVKLMGVDGKPVIGYEKLTIGTPQRHQLEQVQEPIGSVGEVKDNEDGTYYFIVTSPQDNPRGISDVMTFFIEGHMAPGDSQKLNYESEYNLPHNIRINYVEKIIAPSQLMVRVFSDGNIRFPAAYVELWKIDDVSMKLQKIEDKATESDYGGVIFDTLVAEDEQYYVRLQPVRNSDRNAHWYSGQTWVSGTALNQSEVIFTHYCMNHARETIAVSESSSQCAGAHQRDLVDSDDPDEWAIYSGIKHTGNAGDINLSFTVSPRGNFGSGNFTDGIFHFNPAPDKDTQSLRLGKLVDSQELPKKYDLNDPLASAQYDGVWVSLIEDEHFERVDQIELVADREYEFRVFISGIAADKAYLNGWVTNNNASPILLVENIQYEGLKESALSQYTADGEGRFIEFKATIPASIVNGPVFARFRLSSIKDLPFRHDDMQVSGVRLIPDGEVEDYALNFGSGSLSMTIQGKRYDADKEAYILPITVKNVFSPEQKNNNLALDTTFNPGEILTIGEEAGFPLLQRMNGRETIITIPFETTLGYRTHRNFQCLVDEKKINIEITQDAQKQDVITIPSSVTTEGKAVICHFYYQQDVGFNIDMEKSKLVFLTTFDKDPLADEFDLVLGQRHSVGIDFIDMQGKRVNADISKRIVESGVDIIMFSDIGERVEIVEPFANVTNYPGLTGTANTTIGMIHIVASLSVPTEMDAVSLRDNFTFRLGNTFSGARDTFINYVHPNNRLNVLVTSGREYGDTDNKAHSKAAVELWKRTETLPEKIETKYTNNNGRVTFETSLEENSQYYVRLQPVANKVGDTLWYLGQAWADGSATIEDNIDFTHYCKQQNSITFEVKDKSSSCLGAHTRDIASSDNPADWAIYSGVKPTGNAGDISLGLMLSPRGNFGSGNFGSGIFHFNPRAYGGLDTLVIGREYDSNIKPEKRDIENGYFNYDGVWARIKDSDQAFKLLHDITFVADLEYEFKVIIVPNPNAYLSAWTVTEDGIATALTPELQFENKYEIEDSRLFPYYGGQQYPAYIDFTAKIPANLANKKAYARFRFSSEPGLGFSNDNVENADIKIIPDGEVEDYALTVITGSNAFDPEKSIITVIGKSDVIADGVDQATVQVSLFHSITKEPISGYEGLKLIAQENEIVGAYTEITTDEQRATGLYVFTIAADEVGTDTIGFETEYATTIGDDQFKPAVVNYIVGNGDFNAGTSAITLADGQSDSLVINRDETIVEVALFYANNEMLPIKGYDSTKLTLVSQTDDALLGTWRFLEETNGVYRFTVKSSVVGDDLLGFATDAKSTKEITDFPALTLNYHLGDGFFDTTESKIEVEGDSEITADGVATATVTVTLFHNGTDLPLAGYNGLTLIAQEGTLLGTQTEITIAEQRAAGIYVFTVSSETVGTDMFGFATTGTSTKDVADFNAATVNYIVGNGDFNAGTSTITVADGSADSLVINRDETIVEIALFYANNEMLPIKGYDSTKLTLVSQTDDALLGTWKFLEETNGVYRFTVQSSVVGDDFFGFATDAKSTKEITEFPALALNYHLGDGFFDTKKSSIEVEGDSEITADGVATATLKVTLFHNGTDLPLAGYNGLTLISQDGTLLGTQTEITTAEQRAAGIYVFTVSSETVGTDTLGFATAGTTTKDVAGFDAATVNYIVGNGDFNAGTSTITLADGQSDSLVINKDETIVEIALFYANNETLPIKGYDSTKLTLVSQNENDLVGTWDFLEETNGVYRFTVKSSVVGDDLLGFATEAKSTKEITDFPALALNYHLGDGFFDTTESKIEVEGDSEITADGVATATVKVTLIHNGTDLPLAGYNGLTLIAQDGTLLGTQTEITTAEQRAAGIYTFTVSSETVGTDTIGFATAGTTTKDVAGFKAATVNYIVGNGDFNAGTSTIALADGSADSFVINKDETIVEIALFYANNETLPIKGYDSTKLTLVSQNENDLVGAWKFLDETNGVYRFTVKSSVVGDDLMGFATDAKSTKEIADFPALALNYHLGDGFFDTDSSKIEVEGDADITADGVSTATVKVTLFHNGTDLPFAGYNGLTLIAQEGTLLGTQTEITTAEQRAAGIYVFTVSSETVGTDTIGFATAGTTTKDVADFNAATVNYIVGNGDFNAGTSMIALTDGSADSLVINKDETIVEVALFYANNETLPIKGYDSTKLTLVSQNENDLVGAWDFLEETNGVYRFTVKSSVVGDDLLGFATDAKSTKEITDFPALALNYHLGDGFFDTDSSKIEVEGDADITADGVSTATVKVTLFHNGTDLPFAGYNGLTLIAQEGTLLGTQTEITTDEQRAVGIYVFTVSSETVGTDTLGFATAGTTTKDVAGFKAATVNYIVGNGDFNAGTSTIALADGSADSFVINKDETIVEIALFYANNETLPIKGYDSTKLTLVSQNENDLVGAWKFLDETNGVYRFTVKSSVVGDDLLGFATEAKSTKEITDFPALALNYHLGDGFFDTEKSSIEVEGDADITADGVATATVKVTLFHSGTDLPLAGYNGLTLIAQEGTLLGTQTEITTAEQRAVGIYVFTVSSETVGTDTLGFATAGTTTKDIAGFDAATVNYIVGNGDFNAGTSTITLADGSADSLVINRDETIVEVALFYANNETLPIKGYDSTKLVLVSHADDALLGIWKFLDETDGVYRFTVKSSVVGDDLLGFATEAKSTKEITDFPALALNYHLGDGFFDTTESKIDVEGDSEITADGVATATVKVTLFHNGTDLPLAGYNGLTLIAQADTMIGTATEITTSEQRAAGIYVFTIVSDELGSDRLGFATAGTTTKDVAGFDAATVNYIVGNGDFNTGTSTITLADGQSDSLVINKDETIVEIALFYANNETLPIKGYDSTKLTLVSQNENDLVGTWDFLEETNGVYRFTVKSSVVGDDLLGFATEAKSTKEITDFPALALNYHLGDGFFDTTESKIEVEGDSEITADGVATATVKVTLIHDGTDLPLAGYNGLTLIAQDGTMIGRPTEITTDEQRAVGVYVFTIVSDVVGSDRLGFATAGTTTKDVAGLDAATVNYVVGNGDFNEEASSIKMVDDKNIIMVDSDQAIVEVSLFYANNPSVPIKDYDSLEIVALDGESLIGTFSEGIEVSEGIYQFTVSSSIIGAETIRFKTAAKVSEKSQTLEYVVGMGAFDEARSLIKLVDDVTAIVADDVGTATVEVTLYHAGTETLFANYPNLMLQALSGELVGSVSAVAEVSPGVYQFIVKSSQIGIDQLTFATAIQRSEKSVMLAYDAGNGYFAHPESMIEVLEGIESITADGIDSATIAVSLFHANNPSLPLTGYQGLMLTTQTRNGQVGMVSAAVEQENQPGVYHFAVTSTVVGTDLFRFATAVQVSDSSAVSLTYDNGNGDFSELESTIEIAGDFYAEIIADDIDTAKVTVKLFHKENPSLVVSGYTALRLEPMKDTQFIGSVEGPIESDTDPGTYHFMLKSAVPGIDQFTFATATQVSQQYVTVAYLAGTDFDQQASKIQAMNESGEILTTAEIKADGQDFAILQVTPFYATNALKAITGLTVKELTLQGVGGTEIGQFKPAEPFEKAPGEYQFMISSDAVGADNWQFVIKDQESEASSVVTYLTLDDALLQIRLSANGNDIRHGDLVVITADLKNIGAVDALGLNLLNTLPAGMSYVADSAVIDKGVGRSRNGGVPLSIGGNNPLNLSNISIPIGSEMKIHYAIRVGAAAKAGTYSAYAEGFIEKEGRLGSVSNRASVVITVASDPMMSESLILGTVYHDRNGNGMQDPGEPGIPGVRIVSAEGLIITTDQFGRYHLTGIDGGKMDRGRNFILKVDPASLPEGVSFLSPNPLVRRITPGVPVRFDFGVKVPEKSVLRVSDKLFIEGEIAIKPNYMKALDQIVKAIEQKEIREVIITTDTFGELSEQRENLLREKLNEKLQQQQQIFVGSQGSKGDLK